MADLNELKVNLRQYVESITQHSTGGLYVCPLCGSGTGAKHTGAFAVDNRSGERWKCFSCDRSGDIFDLCAAYENISLPDATKRIIDLYGKGTILKSGSAAPAKPAREAVQEERPAHDFSADIERFASALPGSVGEAYLNGRGFTRPTMQRFKLGYNAVHNSIVIPYNPQGTYYLERSIKEKSFYKPNRNLAGSEPVFNAAALYNSDVVFVTESPLCAISIMQEGGAAVAIGGTGKFKLINQLKSKPTDAILVLCLDNDDAGRGTAEELDKELTALDVFHVDGITAIMGEAAPDSPDYRKDPNEVLQKGGADLADAVAYVAEEARKERQFYLQEQEAEHEQRTGAGMMDAFLQAVQTEKYKPMPTGISDIDRALFGGFMRQQLVMLGAAPGAGKTALAQWIFEGMAAQGVTSCIYLNLEMSREQILARSLSRIAKRQGFNINAVQILKGYQWTVEQADAVYRAAKEYKERIATGMIYNPPEITADLDTIISYIELEAQRAEKQGQAAPCVVLDYLQLLTGQPREDAASVIKRAVMLFKGYAVRHNTLVLMIIAHNRNANSTGAVSMEAARDTSAIEYSADLQLALTFTKCLKRDGQKPKSPEDLSPEEQHYITLRIVKGRFGGRGTDVDLYFDGETMTYKQLAADNAGQNNKRVRY